MAGGADRLRGDFDITDSQVGAMEMHLIRDGGYNYLWGSALPQGIIHGDLFRDNVLWDDEGQAGVIDFYFACDDTLLFDVAITVNDWCVGPDAIPDPVRVGALLAGYDSRRPFTPAERLGWPVMLRRAALRTWLGRLDYNHFPREAQMTIQKDHAFSRLLLEHHIAHAQPMPEAW